jgi:hypothetical protein
LITYLTERVTTTQAHSSCLWRSRRLYIPNYTAASCEPTLHRDRYIDHKLNDFTKCMQRQSKARASRQVGACPVGCCCIPLEPYTLHGHEAGRRHVVERPHNSCRCECPPRQPCCWAVPNCAFRRPCANTLYKVMPLYIYLIFLANLRSSSTSIPKIVF